MKKVLLLVVAIISIVTIGFGLCACDSLFSKGDPIESMEFDSLDDEKLSFHGLLGLWGDEYTGHINISPATFDEDDVKIECSDTRIVDARIIKKEGDKLYYCVTAKHNGIAKIYATTQKGDIKTSIKKFIVSGGSDPAYTADEKNRAKILQSIDLSDNQISEIINNLNKVGFTSVDDSSYGWKEDGIDTILLVCDGLVVDLGIKNGATEFIRVYSNSNSKTDDYLELYNKQFIKSITSNEKSSYKAKQENAKKQAIRAQVRSILTITKLTRTKPNSVGGVSVTMGIRNNSSKTIKYFHVGFLAHNAVGDEVYCEIRGSGVRSVVLTGPINAGETKEAKAENYWYNSSISKIGINYVHIEYMDGSDIMFDSEMLNALIENYNNGER